MTATKRCLILLAAAAFSLTAAPAFSDTLKINIGTVAPEGSLWHQILLKMGQEWDKISGGTVKLKIFPGGNLGDEHEMLRKVRINQLQAVALSGAGLSQADSSVSCLQIPMLINSYSELDYIRLKIEPKLESSLDTKGYVVLNWSDVGWVHFFAKKNVSTLAEIRRMKLYTMAGDPESEALYKEFGFTPIPLPVTDMLMALQTGMIEAFDVPPLFAMLDQSFGLAKYMIDVKWSPLVGATIISKKTWEKIPEAMRPKLMQAARAAGEEQRAKIRAMGDEAVVEMKKHGLTVVHADASTLSKWRAEAEAAYPKLRGRIVPADLFDEVVRLRKEAK